MADDDVQLTDLEVIQRYSLAVRGATAPRADLVAALQADLDWLGGGRRRPPAPATAPAGKARASRTPASKAPASKTSASKTSAKPATAPAPAAKAGARAGSPAKRPAKG